VGLPRAVLNYAALLEAPTSLLSAVGERLGLQLPATAPQMALDEFLKRDARHHAACNDPPPTDEWHALSLRTYSELTAIEPDWRRMDALYQEFCRLQQQAANWIELTGAVLRAADVRRRSLAERALAREAQLDVALQTVTAQALERLETMRALRADLDATQIALEQVKAQALERLETMRGLRLQLDATEEALTRVESLSLERLAELERVSREYAEATQALERAEAKRAEVEATLVRVSERLARIETSWWWKAAQSVRRLLRRGG
jgi:chromosome segregation ATPase